MNTRPDKNSSTIFLCRASGEGSHGFRVCAVEADVHKFYGEMFGEDTAAYFLKSFRDPEAWANDGSAYHEDLYYATFDCWKVPPSELQSAPASSSLAHHEFLPYDSGAWSDKVCRVCGKSLSEHAPSVAARNEKCWLVWSNENRAWWGSDRCGYRASPVDAGRYTLDEARSICRVRSWEDGVPPEAMMHEDDALRKAPPYAPAAREREIRCDGCTGCGNPAACFAAQSKASSAITHNEIAAPQGKVAPDSDSHAKQSGLSGQAGNHAAAACALATGNTPTTREGSAAAPGKPGTEARPDFASPTSEKQEFYCDAWTRRAWKCDAQCDGCFRKQYEARLLRAEKLLREFVTTCEVHNVTSKTFFDLWSDAEAARVYFRESTAPIASAITKQDLKIPAYPEECSAGANLGDSGICSAWCGDDACGPPNHVCQRSIGR